MTAEVVAPPARVQEEARAELGVGEAAALTFLAGVITAHGHNSIPFAAIPGLALFTWVIGRVDGGRAVVLGLLFGGLEVLSCWGFYIYSPILFWAAVLVNALGRAAFAPGLLAFARVAKRGAGWRLFASAGVPAWWVGLEYLRVLGPFHPLTLGDAFAAHPLVLQVADLGGTYAVSFAMVALGTGLGLFVLTRGVSALLLGVVLQGALVFYGMAKLSAPEVEGRKLKVEIAQASVPYWAYGLAVSDSEIAEVIEDAYYESAKGSQADLLVWPETAVPVDPTRATRIREILSEEGRPSLLAGMPRRFLDGRSANTAWLIPAGSPDPIASYDKRMLVPVVEDHLTAGSEGTVLRLGGVGLAPIICWESAFPELALHAQEAGAMVVLVDDGGFGHSDMPALHAQRSILRAIEERRPVIHAGQMGPSMLIDERGNVIESLDSWATGKLSGEIVLTEGSTFFARSGAAFGWGSLPAGALLLLIASLAAPRRRPG